MKPFLSFVWEVAKIVVVALVFVFLIRYFLIQPFIVSGDSMKPNFLNGQYLIIDEISYRFSPPQRGDVVVFRYPGDPSQFYIKRIIGLPGESVEIKDNQVIIKNQANPNGFVLNEATYLKNVPTPGDETVTLTNSQFFAMGDNWTVSFDSRSWGPLPKSNLIGKVWLRAFPVSQAEVVEGRTTKGLCPKSGAVGEQILVTRPLPRPFCKDVLRLYLKTSPRVFIYIGYTDNLIRRCKEHKKDKSNWKLIYYEAYSSQKDARQREKQLKQYGSSLGHLRNRIKNSIG